MQWLADIIFLNKSLSVRLLLLYRF